MATEARLKTLRHQRGNIKASVTMFKATLAAYVALPLEQRKPEKLQFALDGMKERFTRFEEIQDELEELDPDIETPQRFDLLARYEEVAGEALHELSSLRPARLPLQENDNASVQSDSVNTAASLLSLLRLPELDIAKFDGSYEAFHSFWDTYNNVIHQYPGLSNSRKLQYLRSLLTGRAAKAIEYLRDTDDNYETALDIIKKKFDNTRKIIRRHWELLHEYPTLTKDTPEALGNLVDTFYQHIRALNNLKQPVDQWDLPLIHLIQSKISLETTYLWELRIKDSNLPKYTSLLEFLENRSQCSSVTSPSTRDEKPQRNRGRRQAFVTVNSPTVVSCAMCKDNHNIMRCQKFKGLSPRDRYKEAKKLSLCINCLTPGHGVNSCNSRNCPRCQQPHHSLLHRSEPPSTGELPTSGAAPTPTNQS
ncbi:uncharacterized protein LOC135163948 [Diachasmimorpha longicaudata]|uniref:uncharacterized protein LOC135163948 n=1 Tax=Diachasmimorpha longicaudata TaxID=58733 RepID=UPI0030B90DD8